MSGSSLLYEAGLADEAARDGRNAAREWTDRPKLGLPMQSDHRRILATAISRTRAKIKYRPVVFELMPDEFTLYELQKTVEAILGPHLHKQNFRRLVEGAGLVEPTGDVKTRTGGRPAKLFRFRREVLAGASGARREGLCTSQPQLSRARCQTPGCGTAPWKFVLNYIILRRVHECSF